MTKTLFDPLLGNQGPGLVGVHVADLRKLAGGTLPHTMPDLSDYETVQLEALFNAIHRGTAQAYGADEIEAAEARRTASDLSVPLAVRHLNAPARLSAHTQMQIDRVLSAALALPDLDSTVRESIKDGNYMIALHVLGNDSAAKWHARLRAAFDAGELREIDVLSGLVIAPAIKGSSARTKDEREAAKKQLVDIAHRNANEEWQNRPSGTNPNKEVLGKRIAARLRRMAYTVRVDHGAAAPSLGSF